MTRHWPPFFDQLRLIGSLEPLLEHPGGFDGPAEIVIVARQLNCMIDIVVAGNFVRWASEADVQMAVAEHPDLVDGAGTLFRGQFIAVLLLCGERQREKKK